MIMTYSGPGDVTAKVTPVDLVLPPSPEPSSTSGCEAADFAGFPAGNVALMQRGSCDFAVKAANAKAAGAAAAVIFNEGQEGRTEVLAGTLGAPETIPVIGTSFAVGQELAQQAAAGDTTVHVVTDDAVGDALDRERDRRLAGRSPETHRLVGLAPGLGRRGPGHQRQRLGLLAGPRDRRGDREAQEEAAEPAPLRLLGRGGVQPARLRSTTSTA